MNLIISVADIITCIYLAVIFSILVELKYSVKSTVIGMFAFHVMAFLVYFKLLLLGRGEGFAAAVAFSIPSMFLCFFLTKYKDFRFVFTFCTVDIMGFIVISLSRAVGILFQDDQRVILLGLNIGFLLFLFFAWKIRIRYIQIQRTISSGWKSLGVVSILFYIMMYLITSYPTPMVGRREYVPVLLVFIVTVIVVYIVIYQAVMRAIQIHSEEKDKQLLETKVALQNSQLELKELYFKMAYTDAVTGLKNRAAFEEKRNMLSEKKDSIEAIYCLMLDLNNLKQTNDLFGHEKGDELIKKFSKILMDIFGTAYRIGGDEFVVLFVEMSKEQIEKQIFALKRKVGEINEKNAIQISYAQGLAHSKEDMVKDMDTLIFCADQRMYENKKYWKEKRGS